MRNCRTPLRRLAALFGAAFGVAVAAVPAEAESWHASEDDSLLLELRSGQYRLGEPLRGYQTPAGVCVDLADLILALDLPVRLDKKSRRATGWLFAEDQRFTLDRDADTVQNVNGAHAIAKDAIHDTPEGWCVDLKALSGWMGVRFRAELSNLAVVLESDRKLPFLEAIERKSRAARLRTPSVTEFDLAKLPQAATPYRGWRTPSVDVQVQGQWARNAGANAQLEVLAAGEALGLSYSARLAGSTNKGADSLRLKLYRNDPSAQMLGPLKATQVALGDVEALRGALTNQAAYGRGAFVSNRPLNRPGRFGVTSLSGTLPAGWDAELYRNGELRAYQADRGDGRYRFDDVELLWGENDFEVVLYGPQGQIKRERSSAPVGIESLPAGKTWYWAGVVDSGRDLIDLSKTFAAPNTGWRWGVGVERGIDRRTTAGLEYQSAMLGDRRHHYIEGTVQRALGRMLLELSGAQQLGAGRAIQAKALGRIGPIRYDAEALWVDGDYESELVEVDQRRQYSLRLSSSVKLGSWRLPVEAGLRKLRSRTGARVSEWLMRTAVQLRRTSLAAELTRRTSSGQPGGATAGDLGTKLNLIANTALGQVRLRGAARFALDGQRRGFENAQLVAESALGQNSTLRLGYEHDATSRRSEAMVGLVRQFDRFALRTEARLDTRGHMSIGLTLGFSLGPDPVDGGWRMSRQRLAETGQAAVEVFRDDNGDGHRQAGEALVEGVTVEAGFRHTEAPTNRSGRAVIDGLTPFVPVLVSIDSGTLPDPLLQPKGQGMVVVPRPGVAAKLSLGLAPTGEVEALLLDADGQPREGVVIELTDTAGRVLRQVQSDFDGYVLFDSVPYGDYRLRIGAASAATLGIKAELDQQLRIDRANPSLRLGRIRLQPLAAAQVAVAP